jgi:hypothetical protein
MAVMAIWFTRTKPQAFLDNVNGVATALGSSTPTPTDLAPTWGRHEKAGRKICCHWDGYPWPGLNNEVARIHPRAQENNETVRCGRSYATGDDKSFSERFLDPFNCPRIVARMAYM